MITDDQLRLMRIQINMVRKELTRMAIESDPPAKELVALVRDLYNPVRTIRDHLTGMDVRSTELVV